MTQSRIGRVARCRAQDHSVAERISPVFIVTDDVVRNASDVMTGALDFGQFGEQTIAEGLHGQA